MENRKKVIFCQGDKRELEEITGEEFEYILPKQTISEKELDNTISEMSTTFWTIKTYSKKDDVGKKRISRKLMKEMYFQAVTQSADAVVHYSTMIFQNVDGDYEGYVRGTLLKKKLNL